MHQGTPATAPAPFPGRPVTGRVRVSGRDIDGLMLCGDMYGTQFRLRPCPWHDTIRLTTILSA